MQETPRFSFGARARQRTTLEFPAYLQAEIDLDPAIDPYDSAVYAKVTREFLPHYHGWHSDPRHKPASRRLPPDLARPQQTGIAAVASLTDYAINRIRKHEFTTPLKEDDRVRQIEAIDAQTGPVMIAYPGGAGNRRDPGAGSRAHAGGRRYRRWRRAPPALDDRRRCGDQRAHPRLREPARDLHRRRPSSLGRCRARRCGAKAARARTAISCGPVSRTTNDHPRLQPRDSRSQWPQRRRSCSPSYAK